MNWVDFDGTALDLDEILCIKRGAWSNENQSSMTTFVHKNGRELEIKMLYSDVLIRLKQLSRHEVEA